MGATDFHVISLELGGEEEMLDGALAALEVVDPGETAFLPEYLAWTAHGSGRAFARLVSYARQRRINVVTTLNLGGDLLEDLPGADPRLRYNALVIFTRHGAVHVPQAKCSPQTFELDQALDGPGMGVSPYARINKVKLDIDDGLLDAHFLICSDLYAFAKLTPAELECDLMVVIANFAFGAERVASRLLGLALANHVASTAVHVNAFQEPKSKRRTPLALRVEEVLDETSRGAPPLEWPSPRAIRSGFYVYPDRLARDFVSMCKMPKRKGRIAVPQSRWEQTIEKGIYPVTVVL